MLEYLQAKPLNRLEFLKLGGLGPLISLIENPKHEIKTQVLDVLFLASWQGLKFLMLLIARGNTTGDHFWRFATKSTCNSFK